MAILEKRMKKIQEKSEIKIVEYHSIDETNFLPSNSQGRGTSGEVFKYKLKFVDGTKRLVAAKLFNVKSSIVSVIEECKKLTFIRHERFPECYGVYVGERKVLFMELCKETLDDFIGYTSSFKEKIRMIKQIAEGIEYLHQLRMVHKDLKPGNVLLSIDGDCKIVDFDSSKDMGALNSVLPFSTIAGTPFFMAPEIMNRRAYDYSCDVFGFGVIVYCIFFEKKSSMQSELTKLIYHGNDYRTRVGQKNITKLLNSKAWKPKIPPGVDVKALSKEEKELVRLIMLCCKVEQSDRPSFKEILTILEKIVKPKK